MQTRTIAHLTVGTAFLFLALSFSFGFHNYAQAKAEVIAELDQALQETFAEEVHQWTSRDSIRAYNHLARLYGMPVVLQSSPKGFCERLHLVSASQETGIEIHIYGAGAEGKLPINPERKTYLTSDTIVWLSLPPDAYPQGKEEGLQLSFQSYAAYTPLGLLALMDKQVPGGLLLVALFLFFSSFYFFRKKDMAQEKEEIAFGRASIALGNLQFSPEESNFYRAEGGRLKLTPLQSSLLTLFFQAPGHSLNRTDICQALWPGKENADETLNTLVRRLRVMLESHTNLKITTDRGKAYVLEVDASK